MDQQDTSSPAEQANSVPKIQALLSAKDDTSRFVGLALLKSVLDNSREIRENEETVTTLWESISPKFLDRLIRTGSRNDSARKNGNDMLDLAISVLHTFAALLPEEKKEDGRMINRIPQLVACLLHCSEETTKLVLETLISLVSNGKGANSFSAVEDLTALTEIAPTQPLALDVLLHAWLNAAAGAASGSGLNDSIDKNIKNLIASFKGTDAVTLMDFLANLLPRISSDVLSRNPSWLQSIGTFIFSLIASRPTAASRAAFTNIAAALLEAYPLQAPNLLFANTTSKDEKPLSYLLVNLLLVDIRSSLPLLLEQLNSPEYPPAARRLTSAFNVISNYIGYLLRSMDSESTSFAISPDHLLKLRRSLSETFSVTIEFLRDRYDASVAGVLGLHPDARAGAANTSAGSHLTLAWESKSNTVASDPLILAATQALAIWLREDDNDMLRKEAAGLTDMFLDLYQGSTMSTNLDFRRPVLVALEGITAEKKGIEAFLENDGWKILAEDMVSILQEKYLESPDGEASRGVEIVRVLLHVAEVERPGPKESWMDIVTKVAAWYYVPPDGKREVGVLEEFQVAALQLVTALLVNTHPGMQKRYVHSISAVLGVAGQLRQRIIRGKGDTGLLEAVEDVLNTSGGLR
ncbi:hypothetical protein OQA88_10409 [Cercophora sp. LCS_1]